MDGMPGQYPEQYYHVDSNEEPTAGLAFTGKPAAHRFQDKEVPHINTLFERPRLKLICGEDERMRVDARVLPHSIICRLVISDKKNREYCGTGFFISPKCVITSGHCVFIQGNWAKSILVIPGDNGSEDRRPFGAQISHRFQSVDGWTKMNLRDFDYGAIILPDDTLYQKVGAFFEPKVISDVLEVFNYGYTGEYTKPYEQWGRSGVLKQVSMHRLYYNIDTESGESGSPILVKEGDQFKVVGIHSYGFCPNFCVRIDERIINVFSGWKTL